MDWAWIIIAVLGVAVAHLQLQVNMLRSHLLKVQDAMIKTGRKQLSLNEAVTATLRSITNTMQSMRTTD